MRAWASSADLISRGIMGREHRRTRAATHRLRILRRFSEGGTTTGQPIACRSSDKAG